MTETQEWELNPQRISEWKPPEYTGPPIDHTHVPYGEPVRIDMSEKFRTAQLPYPAKIHVKNQLNQEIDMSYFLNDKAEPCIVLSEPQEEADTSAEFPVSTDEEGPWYRLDRYPVVPNINIDLYLL